MELAEKALEGERGRRGLGGKPGEVSRTEEGELASSGRCVRRAERGDNAAYDSILLLARTGPAAFHILSWFSCVRLKQ